MRARVRKDSGQVSLNKDGGRTPAVSWAVRAAATLPRGARVSNPLLGEKAEGTFAVFDYLAAPELSLVDIIKAAQPAKGALLVLDAPDDDVIALVKLCGYTPFTIDGCEHLFAANYTLPEAPWLSIAKADKYDHINFKPPQGAAAAAAKGLEYRKKAGGKGGLSTSEASEQGIGSGVARAASLKNRQTLSPETVKRMKAFFDRHEKNKDVAPEYKSEPWKDRGHVAWLLWGGDPGRAWANKVVEQMEAADKTAEKGIKVEVEVEVEIGEDTETPVMKPFAGFANFDACVMAQVEAGHSEATARAICGALQAQAEKGDLTVSPHDPGYLAPEQGDEARRLLTRKPVIVPHAKLLTKTASVIKADDGEEYDDAEEEEERFVLGVVLEPDEVDSQGDTITAAEIRRAAHLYLQEYGNVGLQHQTFVNGKIKILENYICPVTCEIGGQMVKAGTWLMGFRVLDDSIWEAVKEGLLTGLSIGGLGTRVAT